MSDDFRCLKNSLTILSLKRFSPRPTPKPRSASPLIASRLFGIRSCFVRHTTSPIALLALLAPPFDHTFPAPPTHLSVRIETSPAPLCQLTDYLAGHHVIRNHNFVLLLRSNHEGIKPRHSDFLSRSRLRFSTPSATATPSGSFHTSQCFHAVDLFLLK